MLVMSRQVDESIMIGDELCIRIVRIRGDEVVLRADSIPVSNKGLGYHFDFKLQCDAELEVCPDVFCSVMDLRGEKARIGISCPKDRTVHRKEVYDVIRREKRRGRSPDEGDGLAGAPIRNTPKPGGDSGSTKLPPPEPLE